MKVLSNNKLERPRNQGGPRLAAALSNVARRSAGR